MTYRTVRVSDKTDYNVINTHLPSGPLVGLVIPSPTTKADRDWIARCLSLLVTEQERREEERDAALALAFPPDEDTTPFAECDDALTSEV
jgi:hypothetical protein